MEYYPRDLPRLERRFSNEAGYRAYLFQLRWPDGFCCPRCGDQRAWPASDLLWECAACHRQVSVTAGRIFQDRRVPAGLLVPSGVLGDQPEERGQHHGVAARAGLEELQGSLGLAAQTPWRHGATWPGSAAGSVSKLMKPTWVVRKKGFTVGKRKPRP